VFKLNEEANIMELTARLGGIIFKKAELENNFEGVYSKVFERMFQLQATGGDEFLFILGDIGG